MTLSKTFLIFDQRKFIYLHNNLAEEALRMAVKTEIFTKYLRWKIYLPLLIFFENQIFHNLTESFAGNFALREFDKAYLWTPGGMQGGAMSPEQTPRGLNQDIFPCWWAWAVELRGGEGRSTRGSIEPLQP